jgi:hypothetical protein
MGIGWPVVCAGVEETGGVAGSVLTDWISLGVLASSVPRDAVDDVVVVTGKAVATRHTQLCLAALERTISNVADPWRIAGSREDIQAILTMSSPHRTAPRRHANGVVGTGMLSPVLLTSRVTVLGSASPHKKLAPARRTG